MSLEKEKVKNDPFLEMRKFENLYKLDNYYELIEKFTPRSIFIELTIEQINELYKSCDHFYSKKEIIVPESFKEIEKRIQQVLENEFQDGMFIKLSSRSPKDFYYGNFGEIHPRFKNLLEKELERNKNEQNSPLGDLISINEASKNILRVKKCSEAWEMLIASDRIRGDLMKFEEYPEAFDGKLSLVLREWVDDMDPIFEFRGFVFSGKLCCLSQYCYSEYYPQIVERKKIIGDQIQLFFEQEVKSLLEKKFEKYVIDFSVVFGGDGKIEKIYVIELNPYYVDTGACLFRWGVDREYLEGVKDFEFRVLEEEPKDENYLDGIPLSIVKVIDDFRKKSGEKKKEIKEKEEEEEEIIQKGDGGCNIL